MRTSPARLLSLAQCCCAARTFKRPSCISNMPKSLTPGTSKHTWFLPKPINGSGEKTTPDEKTRSPTKPVIKLTQFDMNDFSRMQGWNDGSHVPVLRHEGYALLGPDQMNSLRGAPFRQQDARRNIAQSHELLPHPPVRCVFKADIRQHPQNQIAARGLTQDTVDSPGSIDGKWRMRIA